ncbi:MAG: hypothetical protein LBR16_06855 [Treponema sp.]|jgi:hypothetical protein|nr:hypothetical protein [Treponema sp.]
MKKFDTIYGELFFEQKDSYIYVYEDDKGKKPRWDIVRIPIPLYEEIYAFCKTTRRSYKTMYQKFGNQLREEAAQGGTPFTLPPGLERGSCFKQVGTTVADNLGYFCRFFGREQANVNIVHSTCADCYSSKERCGRLNKCGDFYGCGEGVMWPNPALTRAAILKQRLASEP